MSSVSKAGRGISVARAREEAGTAGAILDVAERLVQTRGFNAVSYGDVAAELGITRPALHYHYAGKAELGAALVERYSARFTRALAALDASGVPPVAKLEGYVNLYAQVLAQDRMCLCGMLAAEFETLPANMQGALLRFFDHNETWLSGVIATGRRDGTLVAEEPSDEVARMFIGALEGAMLVARTYRDPGRFLASARRLLAGVTVSR